MVCLTEAGHEQPKAAPSARGGILLGCGIVLAVLIIGGIIGGIYVSKNWRGWIAGPIKMATNQYLQDAELETDERNRLRIVSTTFWDEFSSKSITLEELQRIAYDFSTNPALGAIQAAHAQGAYVMNSGLTDEEKADARVQLQRVARGYFFKQITAQELEEMFAPVSDRSGRSNDQEWSPPKDKEDVTDADVKDMINRARTLADKYEIPAEPVEVDIAGEILHGIEQSLNRTLPIPYAFGERFDPSTRPQAPAQPGQGDSGNEDPNPEG